MHSKTRTKRPRPAPPGVYRGPSAIAARLGVSYTTLWRSGILRDPRLRTYKIGGTVYATEEDIRAYIDALRGA
jgi:hypothetical protein